jgi:hypothetical protein
VFYSEFFGFPLPVIIPRLPHSHLSPPHEVCDSPDQQHMIMHPALASTLTPHLAGLRPEVVSYSQFLSDMQYLLLLWCVMNGIFARVRSLFILLPSATPPLSAEISESRLIWREL